VENLNQEIPKWKGTSGQAIPKATSKEEASSMLHGCAGILESSCGDYCLVRLSFLSKSVKHKKSYVY
jgi:hypothetical protein